MPRSLTTLLLWLVIHPGSAAVAQDGSAARPSAPPPACDSPEYRAFDFWIGDWDVAEASGPPAGRNRIEPMLGGCALAEHWTGVDGSSGRSVNIFDRRRATWHQTWVDDRGNLLVLEGTREADGSILMTGSRLGRDGNPIDNRVRWTPRADGTVRQHWQISRDGGKTWEEFFDGIYRKRK